MIFDSLVPEELKDTQVWFASIITRPIDEKSAMQPYSPAGVLMEEEAKQYIIPSPTLRPAQRIQIYNQQYWWRLLSTLHESFPFLTRLFGYQSFNQSIGIPYLDKNPPNHWSLNLLGSRLTDWIKREYKGEDHKLVYDAAALDWAYDASFVAPFFPTIDASLLSENQKLLSTVLYLQPYVVLFKMEYDLFSFRLDFLKQDPDYWLTHDFPPLTKDKTYYFVLYRNRGNAICYQEIYKEEWMLLNRFNEGSSIESACQWLEEQNEEILDSALSNLHIWFQEWTARQWFALERK